ncbi:hypothetical protein GDO81_003946 [Engystomops pustulosus]|uniref:Uncharacterized protein n=1 Tax=Engystomops pustulosus TaxID=76066 RepID=A0AAV7A154_ENGPU|nr:hypothetical protein GDO81_003946 [Engystomops pustulosus]
MLQGQIQDLPPHPRLQTLGQSPLLRTLTPQGETRHPLQAPPPLALHPQPLHRQERLHPGPGIDLKVRPAGGWLHLPWVP